MDLGQRQESVNLLLERDGGWGIECEFGQMFSLGIDWSGGGIQREKPSGSRAS